MAWYDMFFPAAKPLQEAAKQGTPATPAAPQQGNAGIDMAAEAQKAADRMKQQQAQPGPIQKTAQKKGAK